LSWDIPARAEHFRAFISFDGMRTIINNGLDFPENYLEALNVFSFFFFLFSFFFFLKKKN